MAVDKTDGAAAQVEAPKGGAKKPKKAGSSKKMSSMERFIADTKATYKDLDMSEGRKMRKRPASTASAAGPKKAKKTPAKKAPAAKKGAGAKKGAAAAKSSSSEEAKKE